jgi:DNA polymerase-4
MLKPFLKFEPKESLDFNPKIPQVMHIDINSCFATVEQQANPFLRGKAVVVAAYKSPGGCILAPSIEAKRLGIKTGMRVFEAQTLCPEVVVLESDPWKYRQVHLSLKKILSDYSFDLTPKSIDEFVLNLEGYPALLRLSPFELGGEIKSRIKSEIGDWMSVSIGVAPNRFLAKVASNLKKPDGLEEISINNFKAVYSRLKLTDLCGIKQRSEIRLNRLGIFNVWDFYQASIPRLRAAFESILGYYWYLRLRGWEVDDVVFARKSYGNSFALPKPLKAGPELSPIVCKLTEKMTSRLRRAGFQVQGVHLAICFRDWTYWHKGVKTQRVLFDSRDIYKELIRLMEDCPSQKLVREVAVSSFNLVKFKERQLDFFEDVIKKEQLTQSIDALNERWGDFVVAPGRLLNSKGLIKDRIAFGGVKELEEFTLRS